jgi:hypothetical protein
MGCGHSAHDTRLQTVDDSVHVMLKHDKKRQQQKGEAPKGYVPRAEHPLLKQKPVEATEEDDGPTTGSGSGGANTATTAGAD